MEWFLLCFLYTAHLSYITLLLLESGNDTWYVFVVPAIGVIDLNDDGKFCLYNLFFLCNNDWCEKTNVLEILPPGFCALVI